MLTILFSKTCQTFVQLNQYETDLYFLQNLQCTTRLIHAFVRFVHMKLFCNSPKQKQFQVHNSYKTGE